MQHAICPAKSYYFAATREAGLVQIAKARFEQDLIWKTCFGLLAASEDAVEPLSLLT